MSCQSKTRLLTNVALGCILTLSQAIILVSCTTAGGGGLSKDDNLAAAGFVERPANNQERKTMQARLPANKFLRRVNGNTVSYVYSDPAGCNCIYIGSQKAYDHYRQSQQQRRILNQEEWVAQDYNDDLWDWDAWGPSISGIYGPFGPGWD